MDTTGLAGLFEDLRRLHNKYFSYIATWKQEIRYLWNSIGETRARTSNPLLCKTRAWPHHTQWVQTRRTNATVSWYLSLLCTVHNQYNFNLLRRPQQGWPKYTVIITCTFIRKVRPKSFRKCIEWTFDGKVRERNLPESKQLCQLQYFQHYSVVHAT